MKITRQQWIFANVLYNKYLMTKGKPISRKRLAEAMGVTEQVARNILFAIRNRDIMTYSTQEFSFPNTTELIISDLHIPYHDELAVHTVFDYLEDNKIKPNIITILGDLIDFYKISRYVNNPNKKSVKEEIIATYEFLKKLREKFSDAKIIYKEGNHSCVAEDTLVLTKEGWKNAGDITENDLVAQYDLETGEISFVNPIKVVKYETDNCITFNSWFSNEKVSLTHRFVIDGKLKDIKDIIREYEGIIDLEQKTYCGHLVDSERKPLELTDDEVLLLFYIALAMTPKYIDIDGGKIVTFCHAKSRVKELLDRIGHPYKIRHFQWKFIEFPLGKFKKYFSERTNLKFDIVYQLNRHHIDLLLSNLPKYSSLTKYHMPNQKNLVSPNIHNLRILQTACVLNNYIAVIKKTQIFPKLLCYDKVPDVTYYKGHIFGLSEEKCIVVGITVPKHTIITNRDDTITVTGNSRLQKYIWSHAKEISDLLDGILASKLHLDELQIEYITDPFAIGKLWHLHGHEKPGGSYNPEYVVNVMWKYIHDHFVVGHFHRNQQKVFKAITKRMYLGTAVGCLCKDMEYAILNNWTKGFAIVKYDDKGNFKLSLKTIIDGEVF